LLAGRIPKITPISIESIPIIITGKDINDGHPTK